MSAVGLTLSPTVPDAALTPLGREQSRKLHDDTAGTVQKDAELLVVSPVSHSLGSLEYLLGLQTDLDCPSSPLRTNSDCSSVERCKQLRSATLLCENASRPSSNLHFKKSTLCRVTPVPRASNSKSSLNSRRSICLRSTRLQNCTMVLAGRVRWASSVPSGCKNGPGGSGGG